MPRSLRAVAPFVGAAAISIALAVSAHANVDALASEDQLSGSTNAIFLGGTFAPTPSSTYVDTAESLYLKPLGFDGASTICDMVGNEPCYGSLQVLTTPELLEEGPSTLEDKADIVSAVEAEYNAGDMSAADPLTVFAYSQSAMAVSAAEQTLYDQGIPSADLRLVFIGDPSTANGVAPNIFPDLTELFGGGVRGTTLTSELLTDVNEDQFAPGGSLAGLTPDGLYQTTIYTIDTDGVADWQEDWNAALAADNGNLLDALLSDVYHFFTTHAEYLGLTPADIATGVATTDGLTTTITIPDGSDPGAIINDPLAFVDALGNGIASSGLLTSLTESVLDLFSPAYA